MLLDKSEKEMLFTEGVTLLSFFVEPLFDKVRKGMHAFKRLKHSQMIMLHMLTRLIVTCPQLHKIILEQHWLYV